MGAGETGAAPCRGGAFAETATDDEAAAAIAAADGARKQAPGKILGLAAAAALGDALLQIAARRGVPNEDAPWAVLYEDLGLSARRALYYKRAATACARFGRLRRLREGAVEPKALRDGLGRALFYLGSLPRDELEGVWGWDGATWREIPRE